MSPSSAHVASFPLEGIQLLEASAGTGKTWSISSLYVRLILGHKRNQALMPSDILVVTFTKAATQELQDRIRQRLNEAAKFLRSPDDTTEDPLLKGLLEEYGQDPEASAKKAHRLVLAAESMDDAAIFTIHGWCQRMLRQHAFNSGSLFSLTIETDEAELLKESVRDFWRTTIYPLDQNDLIGIQSLAKGPETLLGKIRSLISLPPATFANTQERYPEALKGLASSLSRLRKHEEALRESESHVRSLWFKEHEEIKRLILASKDEGQLNNRIYTKNVDQWLEDITAWSQGQDAPDDSLKFRLFAQGDFKLNDKYQGPEPQHPAFEAIRDYLALKSNKAAQLGVKQALYLEAAAWVRDHFARIKNDRAVIDQNDLILKLHEAVTGRAGSRLIDIIRKQYPIALIDEFQDTDPLQYEIFKAIYGEMAPDQLWLMVGDPKQAIYGFRGADIYSYLDARNQKGLERHTLGTNHRSTQEMVEAVNQLFAFAEAHHDKGAFYFEKGADGSRQIRFEKVAPKDFDERLYRDGKPLTGIRYWYDSNEGETLGADKYRDRMARITANSIVDLLNHSLDHQTPSQNKVFFSNAKEQSFRPLEPSDIAILVSSWKEAKVVQEALRSRGLKSVYLSDKDSIFKTDEARDIAVWLEAFLSPREGRRVRAAMATMSLAQPYSYLEALNRDEIILDGLIQRFVEYGDIWQTRGILPAIRQFILDQDLASSLMEKPQGERSLTNLLHLSELLQREASSLDGPVGLIRFLREALENAGNDEENVLRLESDSTLIRVITIHKSKGLEFPLVFLPFICHSRSTQFDDDSYKFHDQNLKLIVSLDAEPLPEGSPADLVAREALQEALRLLYVAVTRAKHACWLGVAPFKPGNGKKGQKDEAVETSLHQSAFGYLLNGGAPITVQELPKLLEKISEKDHSTEIIPAERIPETSFEGTADKNQSADRFLKFCGQPFETWRIDSYSRLLDYKMTGDPESGQEGRQGEEKRRDKKSPKKGAREGFHDFPAGPSHGDFLHKLLESVGREGFDRVAADPLKRSALVEKALTYQSYGEEWKTKLDVWLDSFLQAEFEVGPKRLSLSELRVTDCRMEMEFWFEIKNSNLRTIDQIVRHYLFKESSFERPILREEHLNGMLKGFMDLTFRFGGQFYIADYKSNQLGNSDKDYTPENQDREILKHRYDLQYSIYLLALHRYLRSRLGSDYDYDQCVGGVTYFFLRGVRAKTKGLHFIKPPRAMIEALDAVFDGRDQAVILGT